MQIINEIQISFLTCVLVYIWTRTDAVYEYLDYFKLSNFSIFKEYKVFKSSTPVPLNFIDFLLVKKPSFLTKLITCPICLSIYSNCFFYFLFMGLGIKQANVFFSIYLSWLLFFCLEKLNK